MMVKKLLVCALLLGSISSSAQWATSGTNIYNTNSGNVGIGTTAPGSKLEIIGPGSTNSFLLTSKNNWSNAMSLYSAGGESYLQSSIGMFRARGTYASPTTILAGDRIGSFGAFGYTTTYNTGAAMEMYAGSSLGTYIIFGTTQTPGASRIERMRITEGGNIGIGTTSPSYLLDVNGIIRATSVIQSSDQRLKERINPIEGALDKISSIDGVSYYFNTNSFQSRAFPKGEQIGVLAQQIQKIYPNLVSEDSEGYLSVDYLSLIPLLIEGIKELNQQIVELKAESTHEKEVQLSLQEEELVKNSYLQNLPNPFNETVKFEYRIPSYVKSAHINFYDLSGKSIGGLEVSNRGEGSVVTELTLEPGLYIYALVLDGKPIITKKMIRNNR
jgi:Chaperone of endosialidase